MVELVLAELKLSVNKLTCHMDGGNCSTDPRKGQPARRLIQARVNAARTGRRQPSFFSVLHDVSFVYLHGLVEKKVSSSGRALRRRERALVRGRSLFFVSPALVARAAVEQTVATPVEIGKLQQLLV